MFTALTKLNPHEIRHSSVNAVCRESPGKPPKVRQAVCISELANLTQMDSNAIISSEKIKNKKTPLPFLPAVGVLFMQKALYRFQRLFLGFLIKVAVNAAEEMAG